MIFSSFLRAFSVHERLLSEKQLKHGRVISTPTSVREGAASLSHLKTHSINKKKEIIINTILLHLTIIRFMPFNTFTVKYSKGATQ